ENWEQIIHVIKQRRNKGYAVCVVHSALSGISDKLEEILEKAPKQEANTIVEEIKRRHLELGEALDIPAYELLSDSFIQFEQLVKGIELIGEASYKVQARLLAMGELMATRLGAAYVQQELGQAQWLDSRSCIKTEAPPDANERSRILSAVSETDFNASVRAQLEEQGPVVVTQGFIGSSRDGHTVVLGRGGSDVSAAYFAAKIGAERLEIWTDVPGLFSANPQKVPSARLLKHLSYEEAQEIATNGADILHPRSILPARRHYIPIQCRCTQRPELSGTVISDDLSEDEALVKAIAVRNNVTLISMESLGMWQEVGFLAEAFAIFKKYRLSIDLISTSESNVTVSLDPALNTHFQDIRESLKKELSELCKVKLIESVSAVSLLGRRIRTILHQLGDTFEVFQEHKVYLVSQASNDLNFTFVVKSDHVNRLVRQMHEHTITQSGSQQSFGLTWPELMGEQQHEAHPEELWWRDEKQQLVRIFENEGSCYVYNTHTLRSSANIMKQLDAIDQHLYAIKANGHPEVLTVFRELGFGFECVSIEEVRRFLELFRGFPRKRTLSTPHFAPQQEYSEALKRNVNLTLDNIYPLRNWKELFRGKELFIRIDPGHGHGHHKHVRTGGVHSKFGIPRFEVQEVAGLIEELDISVKGLHAHIGSGIKDPLSWKETALNLHQVAEQLGGVDILDLGGGFGIRENERQAHLDMQEVSRSLQKFKKAHPQYDLWVEPGRFLVAVSGVLLTQVTQLKGK